MLLLYYQVSGRIQKTTDGGGLSNIEGCCYKAAFCLQEATHSLLESAVESFLSFRTLRTKVGRTCQSYSRGLNINNNTKNEGFNKKIDK